MGLCFDGTPRISYQPGELEDFVGQTHLVGPRIARREQSHRRHETLC
jgi:replication-associated recombination protein RarA